MPRACVREGARWCQLAVTSIVCIAEGRQRQRPQAVILAHVELFVLREGPLSCGRVKGGLKSPQKSLIMHASIRLCYLDPTMRQRDSDDGCCDP